MNSLKEAEQWVNSVNGMKYREVMASPRVRENIENLLNLNITGFNNYETKMECYINTVILLRSDFVSRDKKFRKALKAKSSINRFTMEEIFLPEFKSFINQFKKRRDIYTATNQNSNNTNYLESSYELELSEVIRIIKKYGLSNSEATIKKWLQPSSNKIKSTLINGHTYVKREDLIEFIKKKNVVYKELFDLANTEDSTVSTHKLKKILDYEFFRA